MLARVLIANRGEVTSRISRACRELGLDSIAVYSEVDRHGPWLASADEAYCVGPKAPRDSYLRIDRILEVADRAGAHAVHPGYGFLAESAEFAREVQAAGLVWIGPSPGAIETMGDKTAARLMASEVGVPVVPGDSDASDAGAIRRFGERHGYPIAVKAAFGGGGRGFRVIHDEAELESRVDSARREAVASFGRGDLYVERYLTESRHIEVQLLADSYGSCISIGDRDCSLQRAHQKVIEEAPAPGLTDDERQRLSDWSTTLASAIDYEGVGTVEFLSSGGQFFFIEMNTRLQVEHAVTELVTGVDLVKWQIRVARGDALDIERLQVPPRGHAIEVRVNAEDPSREFAGSSGTITRWEMPSGPGVRVDAGAGPGWTVPTDYDSLMAKIVVHDETRDASRRRMIRALSETDIRGVETTLGLHRHAMVSDEFTMGSYTTSTVEDAWRDLEATTNVPVSAGSLEPAARWIVEVENKRLSVSLYPERESEARSNRSLEESMATPPGLGSPAPGPGENSGVVASPVSGVIVSVEAQEGARVEAGDVLVVVEAMKMETEIRADVAGVVRDMNVAHGATVSTGQLLLSIVDDASGTNER